MINPGDHSRPVLSNDGADFNITRQTIEDGVIACDFTLSNFVDAKRNKRQTRISNLSPTTGYYPLIAFGNLDASSKCPLSSPWELK